jgi:elongation factor 1-alpha
MSYDIKICIGGSVDAGKSTTIGVLTKNVVDDGRGYARSLVLKNKHELETGRTSSLSYNYIKYPEMNKMMTLIDLAGHEKYLKTTLSGILGSFIDYGVVIIGSNMGVTRITEEHLSILLYLKIPIIIIMTKIDMTPKDVYKNTCNQIKKLFNGKMFKRELSFIDSDANLTDYLENIKKNDYHNIIPIIPVSCKTGDNINKLHEIFKIIPKNEKIVSSIQMKDLIMYIDVKYLISGLGIVVSGSLWNKKIEVNNNYYIGPIYFPQNFENGYVPEYRKKTYFYQIRIRSIHDNNRQIIEYTEPNNVCNACIKFNNPKEVLTINQIKKGMIITDRNMIDNVYFKFRSIIKIFNTTTTNLRVGYQPVLHCRTIRQTAKILEVKKNEDKQNEYECVFQFARNPEILEQNILFFFREGSTRGIGKIIELIE